MNSEESLHLIQSMINEAKKSFHKISPYFIIWGVVLAIAGFSEYFLVYQMGYQWGYFAWVIAGTLGGIATFLYSKKEGKRSGYSSFYDLIFSFVWGGFGIALILTIAMCVIQKLNPTSFVLVITGIPTFISGGIAKETSN